MNAKTSNNPSKLKIAFVLDDSLDKTDGVQQYILTVGTWMKTQGHDVHFIVGQTSRADLQGVHSMSKNVNVRFNRNRMSMPLPASRSGIKALLDRENFDVIHVQMPYSPFLAGRVITLANKKSAVIGTFHIAPHSELVHVSNIILRAVVARSIPRFDKIISVSKVAQSFSKKTFKIDSIVIPNTLDLASFENAKPFPEYKDTLNIVFVGRLVERKGCMYLLKAISLLNEQNALPKICKVIICGKGPQEAKLKAFVQSNNLSKIVEFKGYISEEDKPRYLAGADIAVYPSTGGESFGIVLLEAMAAARGVVFGGNNPGYASVIGERRELLVDPHKIELFAEKLKMYLEDAKLRREIQKWQKTFVQQFDVNVVGRKIIEVYTEALRNRRD